MSIRPRADHHSDILKCQPSFNRIPSCAPGDAAIAKRTCTKRGSPSSICLRERDGALDDRVWKSLLNRLKRRLPSSAPAEDLLQSAYIRLEQYRQKHVVVDPEAFLVQVAVNLNIDENRRRKWIDDRPFDETCSAMPNLEPLQDEVISARERLGRVNHALEQMPPRTRAIFLQHRIDGRKYREIAESMGISQSAVEKHIARAVLFLAERTEEL